MHIIALYLTALKFTDVPLCFVLMGVLYFLQHLCKGHEFGSQHYLLAFIADVFTAYIRTSAREAKYLYGILTNLLE